MSNQAIPVDAEELARLREELLRCRSRLAIAAEESAGDDELIAQLRSSNMALLEACENAKKFLQPNLVEPGRTVFWELVSAIDAARQQRRGK